MFEYLQNTYLGKKVFLTGHTGFKGAWLLQLLHLLGAEVKGYSLAPENENDLFNLIKGQEMCDSVIGDLRNKKKLTDNIEQFKPDFIFHLAAQPLVRLSYQIPSETFEVNAVGTANVLDGMRNLEGECNAVLITTDKVYHNYEWLYPYRETDRLGGYDPYSASKACAELIIDSYRNSFFNEKDYQLHKKAVAVARAGNVIGGGDWAKDRLIPDIARALGFDKKITIRNPDSVRPWQHVLEPLIGYLLLGSKLKENHGAFGEAYNFGPYSDDALAVKYMVELAIKSWGNGAYKIDEVVNQLHEAGLLKLDINKATTNLGWRPKLNAAQAVKLSIDWYKHYFINSESIAAVTKQQIIDYLDKW